MNKSGDHGNQYGGSSKEKKMTYHMTCATPGYLPNRLYTNISQKHLTSVFTLAQFTIAKL